MNAQVKEILEQFETDVKNKLGQALTLLTQEVGSYEADALLQKSMQELAANAKKHIATWDFITAARLYNSGL